MATRTAARSDVRWAGLSPAARRAARRVMLVDATFELLGTQGWAGTTVRAVCQRARLNPRYFYESFEDLDALAVAVYDRTVDELAAAFELAQPATDTSPRAHVRAAAEAIVAFVDDDRRRARILFVEALGNEALNRRRVEAGRTLVSSVERGVTGGPGHPLAGDPVGRMAAAMLVGGLGEMLVEWLGGRIPVSRGQFVEDVTSLALAVGETAAAIAARRDQALGDSPA